MNLEDYRSRYSNEDAPGWEAIDAALSELYPDQEPTHYGPEVRFTDGGSDPIDGISVYRRDDHLHLVTHGFSALYYDEEAAGGQFSGFGFELTMRLKLEEEDDVLWAMNLLQNLARYVFTSNKWFEQGHFIHANGPIKLGAPTKLVAVAFGNDSELQSIDTPHGKVQFVQAFGVTQHEFGRMSGPDQTAHVVLAAHQKVNPLLITDLARGELAALKGWGFE